ncbi:D-ribulokinase YDR109C-like [Salvia hispanica]|uniref:D-ribulokinase YDR109C-like n=1 Tax=Salvia hispanica TaxID=49212 RepID=UPI002009882B|nr:D-ribulokinase YDR109C-like [Salvia hispanica]
MSGANRLINPPKPNQGHLSSAVEMTTPNCPITPRSRTGPMFLGVDVGTASARAAIFNNHGRLLGFATSPIQIWKDGDCVEESSTDIWHAICTAVRSACSVAQIKGEQVTSLGFAATCSLGM